MTSSDQRKLVIIHPQKWQCSTMWTKMSS